VEGKLLRGRKGIGKLIETETQIRKLLMRKKRKRNRWIMECERNSADAYFLQLARPSP
jgi:hypothetical protein